MKREYDTGIAEAITFFTGKEIEKTPAYNMQTLFVVGVQSVASILEMAGEHYCTHIYFGANQSFDAGGDANNSDYWRPWKTMIHACLDSGYWCTLDFDVRDVEGLLESGLTEQRRFIPQISVKLPYLQQLGYNATIKIDDVGFAATNPGVWCHRLSTLLDETKFTDWDQYGKDEIIR